LGGGPRDINKKGLSRQICKDTTLVK